MLRIDTRFTTRHKSSDVYAYVLFLEAGVSSGNKASVPRVDKCEDNIVYFSDRL